MSEKEAAAQLGELMPRRPQNKFVIWDLDNCLSNDEHRVAEIRWDRKGQSRWEPYHADAILDPLNEAAFAQFKRHEAEGCIPLILTGRPASWRGDTLIWIDDCLCPRTKPILVMRAAEDARESTALKEHFLSLCVRIGLVTIPQIVHAYDDRPPIVDMYAAHGIPATVLRANDLCAYTNPLAKEVTL